MPVPSFAFFCNFPDDIKPPYKNYLENQLRQNFNLPVCLCGFSSGRNNLQRVKLFHAATAMFSARSAAASLRHPRET